MTIDRRSMLLLIATLGAGCSRAHGDRSPAKEKPMLDAQGKPIIQQPTDVRLVCETERVRDVLHIRFTVSNASGEAIYVFVSPARRAAFQPQAVCDGGGGVVHVLCGVPEIPPGVVASWKYHPQSTKLDPGASIRAEMTAPIPLEESNGYDLSQRRAHVSIEVARLALRVDFLRASKGKVTPGPGEYGYTYSSLDAVSCEVALPGPVELHRRTDPFYRF
jgi:hypothetical protein